MGSSVGSALKDIRKKLGFHSARSFYMALEARTDLQFNYSYYMKIEADQIMPSEKIIHQLSGLLPQVDGDALVMTYCQSLFPKQMARLFKQSPEPAVGTTIPKKNIKSFQQELTERQVSVIAKSVDHYFLFLLITLSRKGLPELELAVYDFEDLNLALKDLIQAKLIYKEAEEYFPSFPEYVFPKAGNESLKKIYRELDLFDQKRAAFFKLNKMKTASFFKRISPKQADIVLGHLELLFQTIRNSDETDVSYNTEVISFNVAFHKGPVKG